MKTITARIRTAVVVGLIGILAVGLLLLPGCGQAANSDNAPAGNTSAAPANTPAVATTGTINVITREDGSGTRSAFVELFEVQEDGKDGKKVDAVTTAAVVTKDTSVMLTTVAGDERAIGYISLGSLGSSVKALQIDGVEATAGNVKSGSYKVSRPFNIVTSAKVSDAARDFINYIMSKEGQQVIVDDKYIAVDDSAPAYKATVTTGKIVVAGSSSVTPVMEKLKEAYNALNPDVKIDVQQSDSSTGISQTKEGSCDIGMASRELKDTELADGLTPTQIAVDGLAVIVNNNNSFGNLSKEQVRSIFLGNVTAWDGL
jgi:phosphate transport system substrate-binding protein